MIKLTQSLEQKNLSQNRFQMREKLILEFSNRKKIRYRTYAKIWGVYHKYIIIMFTGVKHLL